MQKSSGVASEVQSHAIRQYYIRYAEHILTGYIRDNRSS